MSFLFETFTKDFKIAISYKLQFAFSIISIFITIYTFYLISKLIDSGSTIHLNEYDNSYLFFLIFGIISAEISLNLIINPARSVREMQLTGVFEELIASGRPIYQIALSTFMYPLFWLFLKLLIYSVFSSIVFGLDIYFLNISFITIYASFVFVIGMIGIGLISISMVILVKSSDFIGNIYLSLSALFGGVAYPISVLPNFLQKFSEILPTKHYLEILRKDAQSNSINIEDFYHQAYALSFLSILLICVSIYLLNFAIKVAKKNGSLLYY